MEYKRLINTYERLSNTTKRLEKTEIISDLLKETSKKEIPEIIYLLEGRVFPEYDQRKIGMSSQLILKAIIKATGTSKLEVIKLWKSTGDLGTAAEKLMEKKKQATLTSENLTTAKVLNNIRKLSELEGQGTVSKKIDLVSELLTSSTPSEAKYIVRMVLEVLRVGVAEGIIRDAIAKAYEISAKEVEKAHDLLLDFSEVAIKAKENKLNEISMLTGRPIKPMLAIKVDSIEEAFNSVGKPALVEFKMDGMRAQIHKNNDNITMFTRSMENITSQFSEIIPIIKKHIKGNSCILDAELVGYNAKTKKYMPFQNISQRIKRKYNIEKIAKQFPVEVNVFDIISYENKDMAKKHQEERRKLIEKIIKDSKWEIIKTKKLITSDEKEVLRFYKEALKEGNEGLIFKQLDSIYQPGRRVHGWVKLKGVMETLDLVITGALWGEGKRAKWLSSFITACKDKNGFLTIGKVGTGIKEKESELTFEALTKYLKPLIQADDGREVKVKPELVVEIAYEEIQKSPTYTSGYALRFPRITRIRFDKSAKDISDLSLIESFYKKQKKTIS